ncbi:MAG: hypothetical protein HYX68_17435 [Planctomycetes bacterium]|nr:hypothetical protein [Planctomycetota bacterium]
MTRQFNSGQKWNAMRKYLITTAGILGLALACDVVSNSAAAGAKDKKAGTGLLKTQRDTIKLPEGVIHVELPRGELHMEHLARADRPLVRLSVGKTIIEGRTFFLGDAKGATKFHAEKDGIHWEPARGGKDFTFGLGSVSTRQPGSTISDPDFFALDKLKAGSVFLTTPSIRFKFGKKAVPRPTGREGPKDAKPRAHDGLNLPEGVFHLRLPPGSLQIENVMRDGKGTYRVSAIETVVESRVFYFGDGKGAAKKDIVDEGVGNIYTFSPGSTIIYSTFFRPEMLKSGSIYITTPSIIFGWGPGALPKK